jgi:ferritin
MLIMEKILTKTEEILLNDLAKFEKTAANTYEYFSNCMKSKGMFGADKFFAAESASEHGHFKRISKFMNDLGCEIEMPEQEEIELDIEGLGEILEHAYEMEKDLLMEYTDAWDKVRPFVKNFINEFLEIQTEAVGEYGDLINRFSLVGDNVLFFDQELGNGL